MHRYLKKLNEIKISHLNSVGGKNASLGEMMNNLDELNINLPQGYALTTEAYNDFIKLVPIFKMPSTIKIRVTYKNSIP